MRFSILIVVNLLLIASFCEIILGHSIFRRDIENSQSCGQKSNINTPLIVKGTSGKQSEYPWHVGIYKTKHYICGGTIISTKAVLSAAHCFFNEGNNSKISDNALSTYFVAAGKFYSDYDSPLDTSAQKRQIAKVNIPITYRGILSNLESDLSVVIVNKPFVFNNLIGPACIDWKFEFEDKQLKPNNYGEVSGWGLNSENDFKLSSELKQLSLPYIDLKQCIDTVPKDFVRFITLDKFCAGYTNGSSLCNGDGGGGLVFKNGDNVHSKYYIQGIVSVGPVREGRCDNTQYTAFTKISSYLSFIKTSLDEEINKRAQSL